MLSRHKSMKNEMRVKETCKYLLEAYTNTSKSFYEDGEKRLTAKTFFSSLERTKISFPSLFFLPSRNLSLSHIHIFNMQALLNKVFANHENKYFFFFYSFVIG